MLGGFANISQTDIKGSKLLLKQLFNSKKPPGRKCALDCGAGIGRITKFLLTDFFEKVDLVEQNATFIEQAKKYMGHKSNRVGCYYTVGLQDFEPVPNKYDLIWIQWVVGHLTNEDLVDFLKRCRLVALYRFPYYGMACHTAVTGLLETTFIDSTVFVIQYNILLIA
nr:unnamed protein product [Callosobruchus analis]